jgi:putative ABC transport system permease protein
VLKAIGARNSEIMTIFLIESGIQGTIAGVLGVCVGALLSYIGGEILASLGWSFLKPVFPLVLFIGLILFATVVGVISGILPAYNASKKNPVDSLRYE